MSIFEDHREIGHNLHKIAASLSGIDESLRSIATDLKRFVDSATEKNPVGIVVVPGEPHPRTTTAAAPEASS